MSNYIKETINKINEQKIPSEVEKLNEILKTLKVGDNVLFENENGSFNVIKLED